MLVSQIFLVLKHNVLQHVYYLYYSLRHYYLNYIDYFADISYGYCITVHKAQGSTFKRVYIDAKNILEYNRKGYINYKCLYTSITRASEKVLMFI